MNQQLFAESGRRRIAQPDDHRTDLPLRSVIVTLSGAGSYDDLFQSVSVALWAGAF